MKLTFLGISSALSNGHNANILIDSADGKTLLFDAGITLKQSLKDASRDISEIDAVYISHLHSDHCGSMEWLGYYSYFILKKKFKLYIHESMVSDLWSMLRPAMEKLDGQDKMMTLNDYFDVETIRNTYPFSSNSCFNLGGYQFFLVKNKHVETKSGNMYSYGILIKENDKKSVCYISTDTKIANPNVVGLNFDILERQEISIFYDCDVMNLNGVHPNYDDLKTLEPSVKKKMWLYHYTNLDDYNGEFGTMPDAKADGFAGFVKEGQIFEI